MTSDSNLFRTREQLEAEGFTLEGNRFARGDEVYLPLYEAKMFHQFDHRYGTYAEITSRNDVQLVDATLTQYQNADYKILPWYWVSGKEVDSRLDVARSWLLVFRNVVRATDVRTSIFSVIPVSAVGNSAPVVFCESEVQRSTLPGLVANLTSFAFDFVVRQKVGGINFNFFIVQQLPVLPPSTYDDPCPWLAAVSGPPSAVAPSVSYAAFILPRVLELTYTAWDLKPFAEDCGYDGPPFVWDEERRFLLRCELDAAYFHLYGIAREDVDYIMETFPIVKRRDEAAYGEYRTKRVILEMYEEMRRGEYQTRLDPPPADSAVAHKVTG